MGLFDKAKDLLAQHGDHIDQGIDKAAQFVDEKTGAKYSGQIDGAADTVKDKLDEFAGTEEAPADPPAPQTPPPAPQTPPPTAP